MIISKRLISTKKGSGYTSRNQFSSAGSSSRGSYTLENNNSIFVFKDDPDSGLCLYSFRSKSSTKTYYNKSRGLWKLGIRRSTYTDYERDQSFTDNFVLYPKLKYLTSITTSSQALVAVWSNYPYDNSNKNKTCNITLTATLNATSSHLEISLKVDSASGITSDLTSGYVLHSVGMPEIVIEKDEDTWDSDILVIGSLMGDCTRNPIKYLDSPRYNNEAINYKEKKQEDEDNYKFLKGGQVGFPELNYKIINLGSPGWMSIPLFVFGNRDEKAGFLYYAMDSDGAHAKNFQAFSDGKKLHLRSWDISDHEIVPYGVGGKHRQGFTYNTTNQLGWTIRIRPFSSPTKWVDWYGPILYKEEAVPEQEELGWLPESFYNRYQDGLISSEEVEVPFYASVNGHRSGTADDILQIGYYKDLYSSISNYDVSPRMFAHIQEWVLQASPLVNQSSAYYGWASWATGMTGITSYKSPDYTINNIFTGSLVELSRSGIIGMLYRPQTVALTTGSSFFQAYNSIDIAQKSIEQSSKTITTGFYSQEQDKYISGLASEYPFRGCILVDPMLDDSTGSARYFADHAAGIYHDTLGNWGSVGCFAESHTYNSTTVTHPRGWFTHYTSNKLLSHLSGTSRELTTGNTSLSDGVLKYSMAQSSEFLCDSQLRYVPMSIPLYLSSPVMFSTYIRDRTEARSDFLIELDFSAFILGLRRSPSYKLAVPSFQIIFGDRSILGNWAAPTLSNLLDLSGAYFATQSISGYNSSNVLETYNPTHSERMIQLKNVAAVDFKYFNRLTVYHTSDDIREVSTAYSNAISTESHSSFFSGAQWSGYLEYTKQFMRIQAYEPDYVYHGTLYPPLEEYSSPWASGIYTILPYRNNDPNFSEPTGLLEESVIHSLKKHPVNNSYLLTLSNWTDSSRLFSGSFIPSIYNISSAYEVYKLTLTGANAGTKSIYASSSPLTTYSVEQTLASGEVAAFEFVPATSLRSSFNGNYLAVDYTPVRYSYNSRTIATTYQSVPYSYTTYCDDTYTQPYAGYKAFATQSILNNLPPWMSMRQLSDSCGWQVINAWGMALESVVENSIDTTYNLFLETSDKLQRSTLSFFDLDKLYSFKISNRLFNSSFQLVDKASNLLPAGWTDYGRGSTYIDRNSKSIIGNAVSCTNGLLSQIVYVNANLDSIVGSIYVRAPSASVNVGLVISVEKLDGTSISIEGKIETRSEEWRRLSVPLSIQDEVYRIEMTVYSYGPSTVYFAGAQLEQGTIASKWARSISDRPYWVKSGITNINTVQAVVQDGTSKKIPIIPIGDQEEFLTQSVPTRIEKINDLNQNLSITINQEFGRRVNSLGEVYPTRWIVSDANTIDEYSSSPTLFDKFGSYSLKHLRFRHDGILGIIDLCEDYTLVECTIRDSLLYVLSIQDGTYTIKIATPRVPPNGESYLEVLCDFDLDLTLDEIYSANQISESVSTLGFSATDNSILVINTNLGRQVQYKLHFDYYYLDPLRNRIYMLDNYNGCKIQVI